MSERRVIIRPAESGDLEHLLPLRCALWPDGTVEEHRAELGPMIQERRDAGGFAVAVLAAVAEPGEIVGFVEAGLRSHADGCDAARPVGYLEGWFVAAEWRRQGVGGMLLRAAEDWARRQGCVR